MEHPKETSHTVSVITLLQTASYEVLIYEYLDPQYEYSVTFDRALEVPNFISKG